MSTTLATPTMQTGTRAIVHIQLDTADQRPVQFTMTHNADGGWSAGARVASDGEPEMQTTQATFVCELVEPTVTISGDAWRKIADGGYLDVFCMLLLDESARARTAAARIERGESPHVVFALPSEAAGSRWAPAIPTLSIPADRWQQDGGATDPSGVLRVVVSLLGALFHCEAVAVEMVGGMQQAAAPAMQDRIEAIHDAMAGDGPWETVTIPGYERTYVVMMTPFCS